MGALFRHQSNGDCVGPSDGAKRDGGRLSQAGCTFRQLPSDLGSGPRNTTSLLVRAAALELRVIAVKFGLELASQPKARRDAKEASDARTALRKRWVAMVEKLGLGYRTKRGAEMLDWVAVAHLPSLRSGVSCTDGQWRHQGRSCRIGSEQCAASTRRPARGYRLRRHHFRRKRQPLQRRRQTRATRMNSSGIALMLRRSMQLRVPRVGVRRLQLWPVTAATTLTTYQSPWGATPQQELCEVPSRVTTLAGGAPTRRRTSATRRRTTGRVALLSITPTSLCSGKAPSNSTLPRANGCRW